MINRIEIAGYITSHTVNKMGDDHHVTIGLRHVEEYRDSMGVPVYQDQNFTVSAWNIGTDLDIGDLVCVTGKLKVHHYIDKNGIDREYYGIIAEDIKFYEHPAAHAQID